MQVGGSGTKWGIVVQKIERKDKLYATTTQRNVSTQANQRYA
jgi:hypothetical protein